jgi:hypothetical protein
MNVKRWFSAPGSSEPGRRRQARPDSGNASRSDFLMKTAGWLQQAAFPSRCARFRGTQRRRWFLSLTGGPSERLSAWARSSRAPAMSRNIPANPPPPRLTSGGGCTWTGGRARPCPSPRPCAWTADGSATAQMEIHAASTARTAFRTTISQKHFDTPSLKRECRIPQVKLHAALRYIALLSDCLFRKRRRRYRAPPSARRPVRFVSAPRQVSGAADRPPRRDAGARAR